MSPLNTQWQPSVEEVEPGTRMRIEITHTLDYRYSWPVFCEPMTVRLRPRCDGAQQLVEYELRIEPEPTGLSQVLDLDGNAIERVWFADMFDRLQLTMRAVVQTIRTNPFDFLLDSEATTLPLGEAMSPALLAGYSHHAPPAPSVVGFVDQVRRDVDDRTIPFLTELATGLRDRCEMIVRHEGQPWPAERTLAERRGSCRDIAVLYNVCCRLVGLPARFVSGYQLQEEVDEHALHAWSEVYLPGAGWRGFDAAQGLAVSEAHVPVAASTDPAGAAPISGSFRANDVTSVLEANVTVRRRSP